VFQRGRRQPGRLFLLLLHANGRPWSRLGLAVGRRVGGAVTRNRARRLLREGFRRLRREHPGWDIVVVARPGLVGSRLGEVELELRRQLSAARGTGRRRAGPALGN
jgi:ribonuclease P protein component